MKKNEKKFGKRLDSLAAICDTTPMTTESYEIAAAQVGHLTEDEVNAINAAAEEVEYTEAELAEMEAEHRHYLMTHGMAI